MGLDISYQALPVHAPFFSWATSDPDMGEQLQFLSWVFQHSREEREELRTRPRLHRERLLDEVDRLLAMDPQLTRRALSPGRHWDMLNYLLSGARSGDDADGDDLGDIAVRGEASMGPYAVASQGNSLCWTKPETVRIVSEWLRGLSNSDLAKQFDAKRMTEAGVYKMREDADNGLRDQVLQDIDGLRLFYADAAQAGYGVLVCLL